MRVACVYFSFTHPLLKPQNQKNRAVWYAFATQMYVPQDPATKGDVAVIRRQKFFLFRRTNLRQIETLEWGQKAPRTSQEMRVDGKNYNYATEGAR